MRKFKRISIFTLVVLILIFILSNFEEADISFLGYAYTMPLAFLIFTTLVVGFVLGVLTMSLKKKRDKAKQAASTAAATGTAKS